MRMAQSGGQPARCAPAMVPGAAISAKVSGKRQDDLPSVIPIHERGQARKHGGVEQAIHATYATIASAVEVAGRFAPCIEYLFDASTLCRRHALPFGRGEPRMESRVYRCKDILDGHSGRVRSCNNPILREEVGDDVEGRDTGERGQLSQVVG